MCSPLGGYGPPFLLEAAMRLTPNTRRGWADYYIKRYNKYGRESSAHMALFYLFLVEDEEWEDRHEDDTDHWW